MWSLACCCLSNLCGCCPCPNSITGPTATKLSYLFGFILVSIIAWVLRNWGAELIPPEYAFCNGECFEYNAVYRVSLAFVMYHSVMMILTMGVTTSKFGRAQFHNGFWLVKGCMLTGAFVLTFYYIPDEAFEPYAIISTVGSVIFIVMNALQIVDVANSCAKYLVALWEENPQDMCWASCLIGGTIFSYSVVITVSIVIFVLFTDTGNPYQQTNVLLAVMNILLAFIAAMVSIHPTIKEAVPESGLFQSAMSSLYTAYLTISAIGSQPTDQTEQNTFTQVLFYTGFALAFLSMALNAYASSADHSLPPLGVDEEDMIGVNPDFEEEEGTVYNYSYMHLTYIMSGFYMASLLTNWAVLSQDSDTGDFIINHGVGAVWVKASTGWFVTGIYLLILLVKICMPSRIV